MRHAVAPVRLTRSALLAYPVAFLDPVHLAAAVLPVLPVDPVHLVAPVLLVLLVAGSATP